MEYTQFGNAGLVVSRLCFGTYDYYFDEGDEGAIRAVHEALDNGVNFFDTADQYGMGRSEEILGKALAGRRDQAVISTKFWVPMDDKNRNARGCGRVHMLRAIETSLRRLQTDYVDLYLMHHPDQASPVEETLSTFDTLVKQGKIRYIGACNHFAWQLAHQLGVSALHNWEPLTAAQFSYSLLNRAAELEVAPFARRFNLGVMTYGTQALTILSGGYGRNKPLSDHYARWTLTQLVPLVPGHSEENHQERIYQLVETFQAIAAKYNLGLNQLAMRWVLSREWIKSVIMGGTRPAYFSDMYRIFEANIDPADLKQMEDMTNPFRYRSFDNQTQALGGSPQRNWW